MQAIASTPPAARSTAAEETEGHVTHCEVGLQMDAYLPHCSVFGIACSARNTLGSHIWLQQVHTHRCCSRSLLVWCKLRLATSAACVAN
jgi:hypothetical protein